MVKGSVGKRLLVVKIMGFFFLLVEVCTVKVVYIQICQSTAKSNVHFTRRAIFSHRFRGLRLVYGDERNEIVNLKFVTRGLILFCLSFFCPLKKCERGNFCEGAGDFSVT